MSAAAAGPTAVAAEAAVAGREAAVAAGAAAGAEGEKRFWVSNKSIR